jgi:hypothetical protein
VQRKILEGLKIRDHAQGDRHLHQADELAVSAERHHHQHRRPLSSQWRLPRPP